MHCPFCQWPETKVVDSRLTTEGDQIRRRRQCLSCNVRFNTYEVAELSMPRLVKRNGEREAFSESKLRSGLVKALEKRPVSTEAVEEALARMKRKLFALGQREVSAAKVGEIVMQELHKLDHVAYIRFASVYLSFEGVDAFRQLIERLETDPTPEMQASQIPLIDSDSGIDNDATHESKENSDKAINAAADAANPTSKAS